MDRKKKLNIILTKKTKYILVVKSLSYTYSIRIEYSMK